jgi:putative ABC transport system permease protein
MPFLSFAFRNLLRHTVRSVLTLVGITASIAVLFSILSFNKGFEQGIAKELDQTGIHFMVVPSGCPHEVASLVLHGAIIPKYLSVDVVDRIRKLADVELVTPILVAQLPNPARDRVDLIYGMDLKHARQMKPSWVIEGSLPTGDDEVIVGSEIAQHDRLKPGDILSYPNKNRSFRVAGVLQKTGGQDDAFIYMPVKTAQVFFNKPDGATAIGVRVGKPERINAVTEELSAQVPGIQIVTMGQVLSSLMSLAASAKIMSISLAIIAIFISAVGVMNAILMAIFERAQEIGMMRAIGASRLDIFRIILKETVLLTAAGGFAGVLLANLGSQGIEILLRKSMPYVPSGSMIVFDPLLAAGCIGFSVLLGFLAGVFPAWKATKISPIEAIKG